MFRSLSFGTRSRYDFGRPTHSSGVKRSTVLFARNIRENKTVLRFTPEECVGLPKSYLDRVPKDSDRNIVVGFDYPDYVPFMMNSASAEARKRYYIANQNRGTPRNVEIMDEIVALRK